MIGDFYVIFYVIFGDFLVGTGEPLPYCNKITLLYGCGFGLKKLGLADPPPPSVGTKSQTFPKIRFEGSPKAVCPLAIFS